MFDIIVIGGGLSGTLAALQCSAYHPEKKIALFERRKQLLLDIDSQETLRFGDRNWTRRQLLRELADTSIEIYRSSAVNSIKVDEQEDQLPAIKTIRTRRGVYQTRHMILTCGQDPDLLEKLSGLGMESRPFQPKTFQLQCTDARLKGVKARDLNVILSLVKSGVPRKRIQIQLASAVPETQTLLQVEGLLNIHTGTLSGSAIEELSSHISTENESIPEHVKICINWVPDYGFQGILEYMQLVAQTEGHKTILRTKLFELPSMLWSRLVSAADISQTDQWKELLPIQFQELATQLADSQFTMKPDLREAGINQYHGGVHPNTLFADRPESKSYPGIYMVGSILDKEVDTKTDLTEQRLSWIEQIGQNT